MLRSLAIPTALMRRTKGRELPETFNPMIVEDLFLEQSSPGKQGSTYQVTTRLLGRGSWILSVYKQLITFSSVIRLVLSGSSP